MTSHIWNYSDSYEYMNRVGRSTMPPLIISVAVTGGGAGKELNPNLPETPEEQAQQTLDAYKAGASAVHIHARDKETGIHSIADPERFREINGGIRELCPDIIIGNTTGVGPDVTPETAMGVLEANPELCSLNMGPFAVRQMAKARKAPLKGRDQDELLEWIFPFTLTFQEKLAKRALEKNIKPELEVYTATMYDGVANLIRQDLLKKPYWIQIVIGPITSGIATPKNIMTMIDYLPPESMYSIAAAGPFEFPLTTVGMLIGGHVRVGLEDNPYLSKGVLAESNAVLVEKAVRIAKEFGREIATPAQAREMLGIDQKPKTWG